VAGMESSGGEKCKVGTAGSLMDDEGMRGMLEGGMALGSLSGSCVSCVGRGKGKYRYISILRLTFGVGYYLDALTKNILNGLA
jgi:hypothetical protein